MALTIHNLSTATLDAAGEILDAAFGASRGWQTTLSEYLRLQPDGWLLARLDGRPRGMVGAINYGPFAYVGLMAVHPAARRRGIGLALMHRLLGWLDDQGCPGALLDATAAGEPLYRKVGFVEEGRTLRLQAAAHTPGSRLHAKVRGLRSRDLAAVAAFDAPIFGARREDLLAGLVAAYPERAFVVEDAPGQVAGYLIAQPRTLGPWAARGADVAETLLGAALTLPYQEPPAVIVPAANTLATELLLQNGFRLDRSLAHMRRGGTGLPGDYAMLYARASFAVG